jgi:hypothetical protein
MTEGLAPLDNGGARRLVTKIAAPGTFLLEADNQEGE